MQSFSESIYLFGCTRQKLPWGDQSQTWHSATGLHYLCVGSGDQLPEIKIGRNKSEGTKKQYITAVKNSSEFN